MERGLMKRWWAAHELAVVVFATGAAILIVEVTATRILSPYFGNTIYTVSSVIGIILGALSLGYWHGGKRADLKPEFAEFYRIIFLGGISLMALFILMTIFLPLVGDHLPLRFGPLLMAMVLFFPPGYLLGMLSPFAIILATKTRHGEGVGAVTGRMFFWSTTGSIAGSLGAGFLLIPHLGVSAIIWGTTVAILLIGGIGYAKNAAKGARDIWIGLIFLIIGCTIAFYLSQNTLSPNIRYIKDGLYERLVVLDDTEGTIAGKPARFFLQDKTTSSGMYLGSDELLFDYTKYYALYKLWSPDVKRALFVGGAAYSIPKALHKDLPDAMIDVVDIEPGVEEIAKTYFRLPDTPNIRSHVADGRRFLHEAKEQYDLIFSDVFYSLYSIPAHMTTVEFFREARSKLSQNGIFLANIIGAIEPGSESFLYSEVKTMREVFPKVYVFAVESTKARGIQNFVVIGVNGKETDDLLGRTEGREDGEYLKELLGHELVIPANDLVLHDILTDDYAPVEHLVASFASNDVSTELKGKRSGAAHPADWGFSGTSTLEDIAEIVALGPRAMGTPPHEKLKERIAEELNTLGVEIRMQTFIHTKRDGGKLPITNIIGRLDPKKSERIILGTHYDSIIRAYNDHMTPNAPMPGANNGASAVAAILEIARVLHGESKELPFGVDLVFFDGEEGERSLGAGGTHFVPIGSSYFAEHLAEFYPNMHPKSAIILDMICDRELDLHYERSSLKSAPAQTKALWETGEIYGSEGFIAKEKYLIIDDHTALIQAGIPSTLLIDFDYEPWFNTTRDTPDKCSAESLEAVGNTVLDYFLTKKTFSD